MDREPWRDLPSADLLRFLLRIRVAVDLSGAEHYAPPEAYATGHARLGIEQAVATIVRQVHALEAREPLEPAPSNRVPPSRGQ